MSKGKRNRSKYENLEDRRWLSIVDYNDDELESAWRRSCERDQMLGLYDRLKRADVPPLNCPDVLSAMKFLYDATQDECFLIAAKAMEERGIVKGGLKSTVLQPFEERTAAHYTAILMHEWVANEGLTVERAAKITTAQRGVPGATFSAAVKSVKVAYAALPEEAKKVGKSL